MRVLEFLAWDGKEFKTAFDLTQNPKYWWEENKDYPLVQYSGIRDKNGVKIYEGHIIDVNYMDIARFRAQVCVGEYEQDGSSGEYPSTRCIGFYAKALHPEALDEWACIISREDILETSILDFESVEVVGHIYKNPELLVAEG